MDYLCPRIDKLVSCKRCGAQTLPPYRLCLSKHVGCAPCTKYLARCACGDRFAAGPHSTFDWIMEAMKFPCKYSRSLSNRGERGCEDEQVSDEDGGGGGGGVELESGVDCCEPSTERPPGASAGDDCKNRWFDVEELREHYRSGCTRNSFTCPLDNCNFVSRADVITEHYEAAHGPYTELTPCDEDEYVVEFNLWLPTTPMQVIRKIFNGYFMIDVKPLQRRRNRDSSPHLVMQNINPTDSLRYEYQVTMLSSKKEITVTVSVVN